ncbi:MULTISPECIES: hypothetical protein [Campylobacter]|uniref:hypothetical protein n=1 Tax=Campylobacter TaxID=194 RepID=UPI000A346FCF|nr:MULTISPECIES: hypothetical protein [unclassified Campylobacter]MCR8679487.1 hypothetical protein [Campylobacter sp. RM19072]
MVKFSNFELINSDISFNDLTTELMEVKAKLRLVLSGEISSLEAINQICRLRELGFDFTNSKVKSNTEILSVIGDLYAVYKSIQNLLEYGIATSINAIVKSAIYRGVADLKARIGLL